MTKTAVFSDLDQYDILKICCSESKIIRFGVNGYSCSLRVPLDPSNIQVKMNVYAILMIVVKSIDRADRLASNASDSNILSLNKTAFNRHRKGGTAYQTIQIR
ncbi:MAG: hypothetical protein HUJ54_10420 [Erysipelotrichaceae bacterium]|nr:hypothetical protein [Erysipelotrichaceae bacterium]